MNRTNQKYTTDTVAAVDLGSNSFHMIVAKISGDELSVIDRMRDMVRLAAGLDEQNDISQSSWERALQCLSRFGQRLQTLPPHAVRAVGTNTLRKARNAMAFLAEAEKALGHTIDIISGVEEARLIYGGVAHGLNHDPPVRRLVIDIGGGSTELILGESFEPQRMESLYMGCVSISQTYFPNGVISPASINKAMLMAKLELEPHMATFNKQQWQKAVGASGTVRAIATVSHREGYCQEGISRKAMTKIIDQIAQVNHVDKLALKGLKDERRLVFPGGAAILAATFERLGIEQLRVADTALREGVLYDLIGRIHHQDVRYSTVLQFIKRQHVDAKQAERVYDTARQCYTQVAQAWELEDEPWQSLLGWAAQLHEVGLSIAHNQYHKHGAYIIENADLMGFSQREKSLLALLIRSHRRKFPSTLFKQWSAKSAKALTYLAVLLRLAVLLHRDRDKADVSFTLTAAKRSLCIDFHTGWLDANPLSRADLQEETVYLKAAGIKLQFQEQHD